MTPVCLTKAAESVTLILPLEEEELEQVKSFLEEEFHVLMCTEGFDTPSLASAVSATSFCNKRGELS